MRLTVTANDQLIKIDTTKNNNYEFTGLSPDTFYTASVYGSNQAGNGDTTSLNIQTPSSNNNGILLNTVANRPEPIMPA